MKKILLTGLVLGVIFALVSFLPGAGNYLLSWLVPPRLYIVIGVVIVVILLKILNELRNKNNRDGNE